MTIVDTTPAGPLTWVLPAQPGPTVRAVRTRGGAGPIWYRDDRRDGSTWWRHGFNQRGSYSVRWAQVVATSHDRDYRPLPVVDATAEAVPRRVQLRRVKGWTLPPNTVSLARPLRSGNPFALCVTVKNQPGHAGATSRGEAVARYAAHVAGLGESFAAKARAELGGHSLACWCRPDEACHADVLLALANPTLASPLGAEGER